jgi:hypothetical protein
MRRFARIKLTVNAMKAFVVIGFLMGSLSNLKSQTADAGFDQTICEGSSVTIGGSPTASGGLAPYTYSWAPSIGLSSPTVSNPIANPAVTTTYTVTITDANATSTSDVVIVTVNPLPSSVTANSNTPICDGSQLFLSGSASGGITFSWTGPNGFSSTIQNPQINPATTLASGTYTFTTVSAQGCSNSATTNVFVSAIPAVTVSATTNVSCNGLSDGTATANATGGVGPYTYSWSPSSNTTQIAVGLAAGTYTVYATDLNGCSSQASGTVSEPTAINLSAPYPTACLGDSTVINSTISGGTPPYTYVWDQGGFYYYTPSINIAPTSSVTFTLTATDANGCLAVTNTGLIVSPLTDMFGNIDYSGGPLVNGGTAVLFNWYPNFTTFDTVQTNTISATGVYSFSAVPSGNYIIKVFPDTLLYPLTVPTYFGDQYLWTLAQVKNHGCVSNDTANIFMVEGVTGVGPGMLQGIILEGPGFGRLEGDPIPGIDIKLGRNPGGALVAQTTTNAAGQFTFDNIDINDPGENYTVYVDLPGRERDSTYNVTVTAADTVFNQLDYAVDSNSVYPLNPVNTGISNSDLAKENKFNVYPNPFKGTTTIAYTLNADADVRLEVYNVLGIKVQSIVNSNQQKGEFKYNLDANFSSGVYFVSLTIDGKTISVRIIKTN